MTADERIEKLLNRFGQTISDIPNPKDYDWSRSAYDVGHLKQAKKAAYVWMWDEYQDADIIPIDEIEPPLCDYICHLADIIDRMEAALETATNTMDCRRCEASLDDCNFNCNEHSKVANWQLSGMYHYEFKEFVEGEGQKDARVSCGLRNCWNLCWHSQQEG